MLHTLPVSCMLFSRQSSVYPKMVWYTFLQDCEDFMSHASILTRTDYEDFLIHLYFGPSAAGIPACINRAYLDFNRTLRGLQTLPNKEQLHLQACTRLRAALVDLQQQRQHVANNQSFDEWHQTTCFALIHLYQQYHHPMFIGQAQKWINMTLKYIFAFGERRLPGFADLYPYCHIPIDTICLQRLQPYHPPSVSLPWSRLNTYADYLEFQVWIRHAFHLAPLDIEFYLWLGKKIPEDALSDLIKGTHP